MEDNAEVKSRTEQLDQSVKNIQQYTTDSEIGAVLFHKEGQDKEPADKAANEVFDGLMYVLDVVGEDASEGAKGEGRKAKDYETVLKTIEHMAHASRGLADDKVPLVRNIRYEDQLAQDGDNATSYEARDFALDTTSYDKVSVMIRPKMFMRKPSNRRPARPDQSVAEIKQPRMRISIKPSDSRIGEITIRVDQEDLTRGMKLTYDIIVGDEDLLAGLDTSYDGQGGHHFSSEKKAQDFGVSFSDILTSFDRKFAEVAARNNKSLKAIASK